MSATTRVNGSSQYLTGTIVSVVQLKAFIIDVGADLQAQDDGIDEAVDIANDSPYGLAGAVYAANQETGIAIARRIRTGQVTVNNGRFNPNAPFGGYKQSGIGRELGEYGFEEFLEVKSLQL